VAKTRDEQGSSLKHLHSPALNPQPNPTPNRRERNKRRGTHPVWRETGGRTSTQTPTVPTFSGGPLAGPKHTVYLVIVATVSLPPTKPCTPLTPPPSPHTARHNVKGQTCLACPPMTVPSSSWQGIRMEFTCVQDMRLLSPHPSVSQCTGAHIHSLAHPKK
jgi:hypothetical protein